MIICSSLNIAKNKFFQYIFLYTNKKILTLGLGRHTTYNTNMCNNGSETIINFDGFVLKILNY